VDWLAGPGNTELNLLPDPAGCHSLRYLSRETGKPAELTVEYVPDK